MTLRRVGKNEPPPQPHGPDVPLRRLHVGVLRAALEEHEERAHPLLHLGLRRPFLRWHRAGMGDVPISGMNEFILSEAKDQPRRRDGHWYEGTSAQARHPERESRDPGGGWRANRAFRPPRSLDSTLGMTMHPACAEAPEPRTWQIPPGAMVDPSSLRSSGLLKR